MVREDLPSLITTSNTPIGAELGVASGQYSVSILKRYNFKEFYCIDKWNYRSHNEDEYKRACENLQPFKATVIRKTFKQALTDFPDNYFDFIYIDGYAHDGQDKGETIFNWYCKLKPEGIYSGHDYAKKWPLTVKYVNKFAKRYKKQINLTTERKFNSWWVSR